MFVCHNVPCQFVIEDDVPCHLFVIGDVHLSQCPWHQMLVHSLQGIFGLLKPLLHVQIWSQSVVVFQNHGVLKSDDSFIYKGLRENGILSHGR